MDCADRPQNQGQFSPGGEFEMGLFGADSGILSTQIGTPPVPVSLVSFGLAPASLCRLEIVEREQ